ncbi:hypothetical protein [Clostridium butyricum]|uniref:hypothetical protein n=1 Tax=Clostridium butyricum TaxID=1492 RepID=UPI002ABE868C|nr:hypothetical protein [Clostridium butyricum]
MLKRELEIGINKFLLNKISEKIIKDFGTTYSKLSFTDSIFIIMLLYLSKKDNTPYYKDTIFKVLTNPTELSKCNIQRKKIYIYEELLNIIKEKLANKKIFLNQSELIEHIIIDYISTPVSDYTDNISPLYTMIGYKNRCMQKSTSNSVEKIIPKLNLPTSEITLIDGCCGTGSLFLGLKTYNWKNVILNDLNPLRTNFLNVLKTKPLKLIKLILEADLTFINEPNTKNPKLSEFKTNIEAYKEKRKNYKKVDCNEQIAFEMFIVQCIDKHYIEQADRIIKRVINFIVAHIKLQNATITQIDCLKYVENDDTSKLLLLDVPYIGSEDQCGISGYNYKKFHKNLADSLLSAEYKFLYNCRSSAPKSDTPKSDKGYTKEDGEHIMKMKLGEYFFNKGYYFEKVHLKKDTELIISNIEYSDRQFQWHNFDFNIL